MKDLVKDNRNSVHVDPSSCRYGVWSICPVSSALDRSFVHRAIILSDLLIIQFLYVIIFVFCLNQTLFRRNYTHKQFKNIFSCSPVGNVPSNFPGPANTNNRSNSTNFPIFLCVKNQVILLFWEET
jgi:hypothetical protein